MRCARCTAGPASSSAPASFLPPRPVTCRSARPPSPYHKSGTPFLQRHLPFWVAAILTQVGLLLIPIIGIAYPVLQGAPALYATLMQHRVSRVYGYLKSVEAEMAEGSVKDPLAVIAKLDALDARAQKLHTTAAYMSMVYTLRAHIQLIRDRLVRSAAAGGDGGSHAS